MVIIAGVVGSAAIGCNSDGISRANVYAATGATVLVPLRLGAAVGINTQGYRSTKTYRVAGSVHVTGVPGLDGIVETDRGITRLFARLNLIKHRILSKVNQARGIVSQRHVAPNGCPCAALIRDVHKGSGCRPPAAYSEFIGTEGIGIDAPKHNPVIIVYHGFTATVSHHRRLNALRPVVSKGQAARAKGSLVGIIFP